MHGSSKAPPFLSLGSSHSLKLLLHFLHLALEFADTLL